MDYKICVLPSDHYACLITCLTYESILNYVEMVQSDLVKEGIYYGIILIDQLLVTGNGKNRFLALRLKDGKLMFDTAINVVADVYYRLLTSNALRTNPMSLKNSILTQEQKSKILSGGVI